MMEMQEKDKTVYFTRQANSYGKRESTSGMKTKSTFRDKYQQKSSLLLNNSGRVSLRQMFRCVEIWHRSSCATD